MQIADGAHAVERLLVVVDFLLGPREELVDQRLCLFHLRGRLAGEVFLFTRVLAELVELGAMEVYSLEPAAVLLKIMLISSGTIQIML